MVAFRFPPQVVSALARLAKETGKTRTRIIEDALLAHAITVPVAPPPSSSMVPNHAPEPQ